MQANTSVSQNLIWDNLVIRDHAVCYLDPYGVTEKVWKAANLSQVEFEYVANVVWRKVGELYQVLSVLKRLAQFLHPRFGTIHTVDALWAQKQNAFNTWTFYAVVVTNSIPKSRSISTNHFDHSYTLMLSALFSISEVHFRMMKGMPSWLFLAACVKSMPKRWSLPWSFLWPHWMARVSRHFLWQANEHCTHGKT